LGTICLVRSLCDLLRRIVATTNPLAQMSDARVEMLSLQVRQRGRRAI
jgi:hypothetical protein